MVTRTCLASDVWDGGSYAVGCRGMIAMVLQAANDAALSRVDRLEQLLTNQLMRLAGDLRSDVPVVGASGGAASGAQAAGSGGVQGAPGGNPLARRYP